MWTNGSKSNGLGLTEKVHKSTLLAPCWTKLMIAANYDETEKRFV